MKIMHTLKLTMASVVVAFFASTAFAQINNPAVTFINQLGQQAFEVNSQAGYCGLIKSAINIGAVTEFVLDDYSKQANPSEKSEVSKLIVNLLSFEFKRAFSGSRGGYLKVRDRVMNVGPNYMVSAELYDKNNRVRFRFRFQVTKNNPKIVDAEVAGQSLARGLRDRVSQILRSSNSNSPLGDLIRELRAEYPACP